MFTITATAYVVILIITTKIHLSKTLFDPFDPFWVFIGIYSVYAWSGIISVELAQDIAYVGVPVSAEAKCIYCVAINLGLLGFAIGYHWVLGKSLVIYRGIEMWLIKIPPRIFANILLAVAVVISLIFLPDLLKSIYPRMAISYKDIGGMMRLEWAADEYSGLIEYMQHIPITLLIASLFLRIEKHGVGIWSLLFVICLALNSITSLKSGGRGPLIFNLFLMLSFYHYYKKKLRLPLLLAVALPLYLVGTTIQHVRSDNDLQSMFHHAISLISDNPLLLLPTNVGEFAAPSGNLLILIDSIKEGSLTYYTWGYSILTEIATFIPRFLFPGRPVPLPEQFTQICLPDLYFDGRGAGFFLLMEGYWSFGIIGVFLQIWTIRLPFDRVNPVWDNMQLVRRHPA